MISARIFLVSSTGGIPHQLQVNFDATSFPVWAPDSKHILFLGSSTKGTPPEYEMDWWVAPLEGGPAVKTGALDALDRRKLGLAEPELWLADKSRIFFNASLGDSLNVWQLSLSPKTWQVIGPPEQLTFGAGRESQPSVAVDGRFVFSSGSNNTDLWSLPLEADAGKVTGQLQQVTRDGAFEAWPCLSLDGRKLVYSSDRTGNPDIWLKDLETSRVTAITATPYDDSWPQISADGSRILYASHEPDLPVAVYAVNTAGGLPQKICAHCGVWAVSSSGNRILFRDPDRLSVSTIALLDVPTGKKTVLLRHNEFNLFEPHFSSDDRWIVFLAKIKPDRTQLFVVPLREGHVPTESDWTAITDGLAGDNKPRWSPEGNLLYFTSDRDGSMCIWAQRLEPMTKKPFGSPFAIHHFHSQRRSLTNVDLGFVEISVARDKLVFNLGELTSNIWMTNLNQPE